MLCHLSPSCLHGCTETELSCGKPFTLLEGKAAQGQKPAHNCTNKPTTVPQKKKM